MPVTLLALLLASVSYGVTCILIFIQSKLKPEEQELRIYLVGPQDAHIVVSCHFILNNCGEEDHWSEL